MLNGFCVENRGEMCVRLHFKMQTYLDGFYLASGCLQLLYIMLAVHRRPDQLRSSHWRSLKFWAAIPEFHNIPSCRMNTDNSCEVGRGEGEQEEREASEIQTEEPDRHPQ